MGNVWMRSDTPLIAVSRVLVRDFFSVGYKYVSGLIDRCSGPSAVPLKSSTALLNSITSVQSRVTKLCRTVQYGRTPLVCTIICTAELDM